MPYDDKLIAAPLVKKSAYIAHYQADLLFPIARQNNRLALNVPAVLPFQGCDVWNGYELSWLNAKGKPVVAYAEFIVPCNTPNLIESKSFKLYLNSFNNTRFNSFEEVESVLRKDLSAATDGSVAVKLMPLNVAPMQLTRQLSGTSLDELDIECDTYSLQTNYLRIESDAIVTETLTSDLVKANCLVTNQPDWGSIQISYTGKQISHEGLLKYLISFRNTNEFAEQFAEHVFMDIYNFCQPEKLCVYARFTRRGGLDINPYRANYAVELENVRLFRQ